MILYPAKIYALGGVLFVGEFSGLVWWAQGTTQFVISFADVIALSGFIAGPPTLVSLLAWRHLTSRIDDIGKRLDTHINQKDVP